LVSRYAVFDGSPALQTRETSRLAQRIHSRWLTWCLPVGDASLGQAECLRNDLPIRVFARHSAVEGKIEEIATADLDPLTVHICSREQPL
jgi:hypothetical protein